MIGHKLPILIVALATGVAAADPASAANAPKATPTTPSVGTPTMTAQVVQILSGRQIVLVGDAYSGGKPLACYSAQNPQRERCAARVTENARQTAEDYLQIYIAEDGDEFERDSEAVDTIAKKPRWFVSQDDPMTLSFKTAEREVKLTAHCAQGLGQENTYAFCAIAVGAHIVVESQVAPHAISTNSVTMGPKGNADDLDRARDLAVVGTVFVADVLSEVLTPELRP